MQTKVRKVLRSVGAGAGWVALAALGALITVIVAAIVFAYRRYTGLDQPYTIVTKQGDV